MFKLEIALSIISGRIKPDQLRKLEVENLFNLHPNTLNVPKTNDEILERAENVLIDEIEKAKWKFLDNEND